LDRESLERISFRKYLPVEMMQMHFCRYIWALPYCIGKSVLDVGCGMGYGTWLLGQVADSIVGVDIAAEAIEEARATFDSMFVQCSIEDYAGGPFAVVVAFEMVEHCTDLDAVLEKIGSLLSPEGIALVSLPLYQPSEWHHRRDFGYGMWVRKLREHFRIVGVSYQPTECPQTSNVHVWDVVHDDGEVEAWPMSDLDEFGCPRTGISIFQLEVVV